MERGNVSVAVKYVSTLYARAGPDEIMTQANSHIPNNAPPHMRGERGASTPHHIQQTQCTCAPACAPHREQASSDAFGVCELSARANHSDRSKNPRARAAEHALTTQIINTTATPCHAAAATSSLPLHAHARNREQHNTTYNNQTRTSFVCV